MMTGLTARQLIASIANEYVELSHDKVRWQRDDHIRICKEWLKANPEHQDDASRQSNSAPLSSEVTSLDF